MTAPNPAGAPAPRSPPRWRHGFTLGMAWLGLLLAWVPGLGLLLSLAALVMGGWGLAHRVRVRSSAWAVGIGILGLLLGAAFTAATIFWLPPPPGPEEAEAWERFERLFDPPTAPGAPERPPAEP